MSSSRPVHEFDLDRAARFRPRRSYVKTAVLVDVCDPEATTTIRARFGEQTMRGPFYAVGEGDDSYGAARREFEAVHAQVEPNRWVKTEPVMAYEADDACVVVTELASGRESVVEANPGDWVIQQHTGEMMVLRPESFDERYEPTHD